MFSVGYCPPTINRPYQKAQPVSGGCLKTQKSSKREQSNILAKKSIDFLLPSSPNFFDQVRRLWSAKSTDFGLLRPSTFDIQVHRLASQSETTYLFSYQILMSSYLHHLSQPTELKSREVYFRLDFVIDLRLLSPLPETDKIYTNCSVSIYFSGFLLEPSTRVWNHRPLPESTD